jgi:protein-tyrosine phosphatase
LVKVLFVCMGNICRSPTAAGVFGSLVTAEGLGDLVEIDSAGTLDYHTGEPADRRARDAARRRGIDLSAHRARAVRARDFHDFDYVLAMDRENYQDLLAISPDGGADRISLFMQFAAEAAADEVPDPYYGGPSGFDDVLDLIEAASRGLLAHLRPRLLGTST